MFFRRPSTNLTDKTARTRRQCPGQTFGKNKTTEQRFLHNNTIIAFPFSLRVLAAHAAIERGAHNANEHTGKNIFPHIQNYRPLKKSLDCANDPYDCVTTLPPLPFKGGRTDCGPTYNTNEWGFKNKSTLEIKSYDDFFLMLIAPNKKFFIFYSSPF